MIFLSFAAIFLQFGGSNVAAAVTGDHMGDGIGAESVSADGAATRTPRTRPKSRTLVRRFNHSLLFSFRVDNLSRE